MFIRLWVWQLRWLLLGFAVAVLLCFPALTQADPYADFDTKVMVAVGGDDRVVLEPKPCESKMVLDLVRPEYHKEMRKITYFMRGRPIPGCAFIDRPTGVVFGVFEDGDQIPFPMSAFKREGASHRPGYRPGERSWDASWPRSITAPTVVLGIRN